MAKIWRVYDGKEPTRGGPWAELPLSEALAVFELRPEDLVSDLATTPRFGDVNRDLWYAGLKHVVVEVEPNEARRGKWKPGFYKSHFTPREAFRRIIEQPIISELGNENVIRVEYEPTTNSQGRAALRIKVVVAPDATKKLANGSVLDALVKLQSRLDEFGEARTPIIEYATEAELEQDGSYQS